MEQMLDTLAAWPRARRRIVIAGAMLELGPTSPDLHREIGRLCVKRGTEWLMGVSGDSRWFVEGAIAAGMSPERAVFCATPEEAAQRCLELLQPGDVVLVKGSRAVHLEKVIELLQKSSEVLAARANRKSE